MATSAPSANAATPTGQASKPSVRLTYERLIKSLDKALNDVAEQYPNADDSERVKAIQAAVYDAIDSAQAGLANGEGSNNSPGKLKHDISEKIKKIHERFDNGAKVIKCVEIAEKRRPKSALEQHYDNDAAPSKDQSSIVIDDDDAAALLSPSAQNAAEILSSLRDQKQVEKSAVAKSAVKKTLIGGRKTRSASRVIQPTAVEQPSMNKGKGKQPTIDLTSSALPPINKRKRSSSDISASDNQAGPSRLIPLMPNVTEGPHASPKRVKLSDSTFVPDIDESMSIREIFFRGIEFGFSIYLSHQIDLCQQIQDSYVKYGDFRNLIIRGESLESVFPESQQGEGTQDATRKNIVHYG